MLSSQTDAIVLRMHPWSETSLIGSLYTRQYGKISVIAKGARRPKGPFEAALDLLSICRVVFIAKSGDSLNILTEAKLQRRYRNTSRSLLRLNCAYYVAELLEKMTEREEGHAELFDLASDTLQLLQHLSLDARAVVLRWELQLLRMTGHLPSLRRCASCGQDTSLAEWVHFGPDAGGVLCTRCSAGLRELVRVPDAVRTFAEAYTIENWQSIPLNEYLESHQAVMRAMMVRTMTSLLDQKLKLQAYIEELGR